MANQLYQGSNPLATTCPNVVDNLTSTSSTDALSAKQGKVLNDMFNDVVTIDGNTAYINGTAKSISYVRIGKIVVFSGRFSVTTEKPSGQGNYLFKDLPTPRSTVSVCETSRDDIILNGGYITSNNAIPVGNYNVFCAYICY